MAFIDANAKELGIEPICRELAVAPSSYHEHAVRIVDPDKRSACARRDDKVEKQIRRVHEASFGLYGTRKVWHQLRREGVQVAKCTVERLMQSMGLQAIHARRPGPNDGLIHHSDPALGRLVQQSPPVRPHRAHPARRGRSQLLCSPREPRYGCMTQMKLPPENPGRFNAFTIIASGYHPDVDDVASIFLEAGCDDAAISFQKGVLILEFDRKASSFSSAVISAFDDVMKAGAKVERFEPDHLVCLSDIAKRTGLSRGALTNYHKGERGTDFPTPVARVTSGSPLWDWCEVVTWLHGREQIGRDDVIQARIVKEANLVIETCGLEQHHFVERMNERIRVLEAA